MYGQSFGTTKIDLNDLSDDFGTGVSTGYKHIIKDPNVIPQSGMGPVEPEPQQVHIPQQLPLLPMSVPESECVKNARHCETCPICSRLYNNNTTYHNYAILFLLIVCIFLIKNLYSYHNRE